MRRQARAGIGPWGGAAAIALCASAAFGAEILFQAPGAPEELEEDLRGASLLLEADETDVTDPQELLAAARADYGRLLGALYANGRYGGVIQIQADGREVAAIPPLQAPRSVQRIVVSVDPGPEYRFSRAAIGPLVPRTELPDEFRPGEVAESGVIADAARAAREAWREAGHAVVEVEGERVVANHAADAVAADILLAPGPLVRFGQLRIQGNEDVRTERARAIAGFPTGEVFDPDELQLAATRLRRTGAFRSVAVAEAERLGPGNTLDVTMTLIEALPRRFGFGAEISTIDGLTLTGFWLHRNLLGGAEQLRFDGEVAGIGGGTGGMDYRFAVSFTRPATFFTDTDLFALASIAKEDEPDYTSESIEAAVGLRRIFSPTFTAEAGVGFEVSRSEDKDTGVEREYTLLTFPTGLTWDRRDDPLNPTEGFFIEGDLTPFVALAGDGDNGGRLFTDARAYRGFGEEDRFILAGRVQFGSIIGASLTGVPNDFRFYSGGGGTVRGHEYKSLDIELPDGTESGGASFLGVSAEVRVRVRERFQGVVFYDYGQIGDESFLGGETESHAGAGLGVRYLSPIGPIRLDVAAPVSGEGEGVAFYVGIGQAF